MSEEIRNFDAYNPTHIVFGKNRLAELENLIPQDKKSIAFIWRWQREEIRYFG